MQRVARNIVFVLAGMSLLYLGSCSYTAWSRQRAFDATQLGDSEVDIVRRFGTAPSERMDVGQPFSRYEDSGCKAPCAVRLWYENRLFLDIEAWSLDLDNEGRVVRKYTYSAP
jgi:hypothetical protein